MKVSDVRTIIEGICQKFGLRLEAGSITFAWNARGKELVIVRLRPVSAPWQTVEDGGGILEDATEIAIKKIQQ